ncbi:MAG: hypothetical protein NZ533_03800 [Casimicrobiaceae bacterium]|nr:hypothetical protein [Casimicrobiaceae bacterium]MCX8099054.1 hypothetical protein [Casimicrobiaceae bacterium]MDW8312581.1 hypothetical protein [Burkholderiales bacterium]
MSDPFPSPSTSPAGGAAAEASPAGGGASARAEAEAPAETDVQITHLIYALYALGLLSFGLLAVFGLILAYVKRDDVAGTYLDSHFSWLIRTAWWSLAWLALIVLFILLTLGIGLLVAWILVGILLLWVVYRIVKGWLRLIEKRALT